MRVEIKPSLSPIASEIIYSFYTEQPCERRCGGTPISPAGDAWCVPELRGSVRLTKWMVLNKSKICLLFRVWLEIKKSWHFIKKMKNHVGTAVQEGKGSKAQKRSRASKLLLCQVGWCWCHQHTMLLGWGRVITQPLLPHRAGNRREWLCKVRYLGSDH